MLVPLSWLNEYVKIDLPVNQFANKLTLGGLEVENINRIGSEWAADKIFVGQVVAVRPHPQADRLVLVTVDYGQIDPLEVVTGAPNLHVGDRGQKVVFAIVGARLIDGHSESSRYQVLKRNKIRGIESAGMVCSEKELGISEEHSGIVILPQDAPVGLPLVEYLGDVILDIKLEPNMARCLSMIGIAREVAALTGQGLRLPVVQCATPGEVIAGQIKVAIVDPDLCPRYSAALVKGVTIKSSPEWMQRRLALAGMRPINNIVDITNYVMLEWGQPLHAFDYHRLHALPGELTPSIIVRRAAQGESMPTLDGSYRSFSDDMLLITDGAGPVAVAGVMGGLTSEVTEQTTDILLEAANFDFISIRRTSTALKLPSEAAYRFGRGVDPELTLVALERATQLMGDLAGGTPATGYVDTYPGARSPRVIDLPTSEVKRLLGIELDASHIARLLGSLGFGCEVIDQAQPTVRTTVPSYRLDVSIPADLVEEVARLYGYDALPCTLIADEMPGQKTNLDLALEERVRGLLVGCGLSETISYSLTNLESIARLTPERVLPDSSSYIKLTNPLSLEYEYLRQTLMNTTLETIASNLRFIDRVAIFEIANIYLPGDNQALPNQPRRLSIGITGAREARNWLSNASPSIDFYDLKGIVETLCSRLGVEIQVEPTQNPTFYPGRVASIRVNGTVIGVFGEIHPLVCSAFDLPAQSVCLLELNLEALLAAVKPNALFQPISRMPEMHEDLALVVAEDVHSDDVTRAIRETGGSLLVDVVLFDVYHGKQLGAGRKSLAYSLTFQADSRTLTTEETSKLRAKIVKQLETRYQAQLRA